jgi:Spy/CpxP family protein refolding chaperone
VSGIRWWRKPDIQQLLNLTKAQVDRLDTVFERERPERIALRRKIAEMDRLLRRVLLRANAEDATVKRMSEQVEALRAQHNVRRTLMRHLPPGPVRIDRFARYSIRQYRVP